MSGKKAHSRKLLIIRILLLSLIPLSLFGWYLYTQFIPTQKETAKIIEAVEKEDKPETEVLEEPEKPVEQKPEEEPEKEEEKPVETKDWWEYPDKILAATKSGNDLLVLVNKKYKLPNSYAPADLVSAANSGIRLKSGGSYQLRSVLIDDLKQMNDAAKAAGVDISVISAYRSYSTQASTYQYWVNYNGGNTDAADTVSARPGHSQHQLGTAMDFSSNEIGDRLGDEFSNTEAAKWLRDNGWKYGFVLAYPKGFEVTTGYSYESWHYRYIGVANAQEWKNSGKILELWLREKNGL